MGGIKYMGIAETNLEKAKATEEIVKSIRSLLTLKLTLPLGDKSLKNVHTNQFLWCDLPTEFSLANMEVISTAMNSTYARYSGYEEGRWYIEGVTITNTGDKFTMDLELNPFASSHTSYRDTRDNFEKTYNDIQNKNNTSSNKTVASVKTNTKMGASKYPELVKLVKKIIGKETDELKKAKLIHKWLSKNVKYSWYKNSKYGTPDKCYKNRNHLNCADTSILTRELMFIAGLDVKIVHSTCHYYTVITIKGKEYCSDATSSKRNQLNFYWKASSCSSGSTAKFQGKKSYSKVCGKKPC